MIKLLIAVGLMIASVGFSKAQAQSVDMKSAPVCVFEQIKEASGDTSPYFVISCGSDVVLTHNVSSYAQVQDKETYKAYMQKSLVTMMGEDKSISCEQSDSEIALVIICKR